MKKIKAVVLSDLDGTLLDDNGVDTHGTIHREIEAAENAGILFGIVSFTSRVGIDQHLWHLGVRPKIYICEDGAYTAMPRQLFGKKYPDMVWHLNAAAVATHQQDLRTIQNDLINYCHEKGIPAHLTHAASFMQRTPWTQQIKDVAIAVDTTRRLSFTMQIRGIANNKFYLDAKQDKKFCLVVKKILKQLFGNWKGFDCGPGWIDYAHPSLLKQVNKGVALRWLRAQVPERIKIYFIGNGQNDVFGTKIPGVISIAVANADNVLKKNVNHVMTKNCTTGVVEALQLIASGSI